MHGALYGRVRVIEVVLSLPSAEDSAPLTYITCMIGSRFLWVLRVFVTRSVITHITYSIWVMLFMVRFLNLTFRCAWVENMTPPAPPAPVYVRAYSWTCSWGNQRRSGEFDPLATSTTTTVGVKPIYQRILVQVKTKSTVCVRGERIVGRLPEIRSGAYTEWGRSPN